MWPTLLDINELKWLCRYLFLQRDILDGCLILQSQKNAYSEAFLPQITWLCKFSLFLSSLFSNFLRFSENVLPWVLYKKKRFHLKQFTRHVPILRLRLKREMLSRWISWSLLLNSAHSFRRTSLKFLRVSIFYIWVFFWRVHVLKIYLTKHKASYVAVI